MTARLSHTARFASFFLAAVAFAAPAGAQPVPAQPRPGTAPAPGTPITPVFGYPYTPGTADLPEPSASPAPAGSPAPDASADPSASGAPASGAPQVDPTSQAPNTYGGGNAEPPRLRISSPHADNSATMRIAGSLQLRPVFVSLVALGLYRHDPVDVLGSGGQRVAYGGVALQFLPGVSALVHPAVGDGGALIGLAPATLVVVGRDGSHATFKSSELIDAAGNPRVFLIDRRLGMPLANGEGPFRVIAPGDKTSSRWVKDVVEIDVNR